MRGKEGSSLEGGTPCNVEIPIGRDSAALYFP